MKLAVVGATGLVGQEILKVLEERGCPYVPRLLEEHPEELYLVSTNCGKLATQISNEKAASLFAKLEREYGVKG